MYKKISVRSIKEICYNLIINLQIQFTNLLQSFNVFKLLYNLRELKLLVKKKRKEKIE